MNYDQQLYIADNSPVTCRERVSLRLLDYNKPLL